MTTRAHTEAVLLLTVWFGKPQGGAPKPLGAAEWVRLAGWLAAQGRSVEALMGPGGLVQVLEGWSDATVTKDRVQALLERGGALGLAVEKWERAGLWVMTLDDADYPARLKARLQKSAPPVLFGCGDRALVDRGGLAIVGSRNATQADLDYTTRLAQAAAKQGVPVVSGGARGVDQAAMVGALDARGASVGVLADSLLRAATSGTWRKALMGGTLALVSPFNPEAPFDAGNAMARNRSIYCLADAAVVVASTPEKGGTWAGAVENLKHRWVPLWIKPDDSAGSGNAALVARGGRLMAEPFGEVATLVSSAPGRVAELFGTYSATPRGAEAVPVEASAPDTVAMPPAKLPRPPEALPRPPEALPRPPEALPRPPDALPPPPTEAHKDSPTLYEHFLAKVLALCGPEGVKPQDLLVQLDLTKPQLSAWLERAVAEGRLKKAARPVRYLIAVEVQRRLL